MFKFSHFQILRLEKRLASMEKELKKESEENRILEQILIAGKKKEEAEKKKKETTKAMVAQWNNDDQGWHVELDCCLAGGRAMTEFTKIDEHYSLAENG
jgi:hypothetical protein